MSKITDQFIRSLQVPDGAKEVQAFDDALPGFGVRKQASGHTTFFVKYTIGTQQRLKTLGPFVPGAQHPQGSGCGAGASPARQGRGWRGWEGAARGQEGEDSWASSSAPISSCARLAANSGNRVTPQQRDCSEKT